MKTRFWVYTAAAFLTAVSLGCSDSGADRSSSPAASDASSSSQPPATDEGTEIDQELATDEVAATDEEADSDAAVESESAGVVKIVVMTDGTVLVDSESVPIEGLAERLDSLEEITEVWYHRESPEAAEPHENATKVIAEIIDRQLPVAIYLDRDFTQRMTFAEP